MTLSVFDIWLKQVAGFLDTIVGDVSDSVNVRELRMLLTQNDSPAAIVTAVGAMNNGKSTLLNALAKSPRLFATKDARCTTKNQHEDLGGYHALDTPGLLCDSADTEEAVKTTSKTDIALVCHSVKDGEFEQEEIRVLGDLSKRAFPDAEERSQRVVIVFTKCDQYENDEDPGLQQIVKKSLSQWKEYAGGKPAAHFLTTAEMYLDGLKEQDEDCMNVSGISELRAYIKGKLLILNSKGLLVKKCGEQLQNVKIVLAEEIDRLGKELNAQRERGIYEEQILLSALDNFCNNLTFRKHSSRNVGDPHHIKSNNQAETELKRNRLDCREEKASDGFLQQRNEEIRKFGKIHGLPYSCVKNAVATSPLSPLFRRRLEEGITMKIAAHFAPSPEIVHRKTIMIKICEGIDQLIGTLPVL